MKKLYIKPETEVVTNDYLCEPDAPLPGQSRSDGTEDFGARGTTYRNENYIENPFRRYNPWE